MQTQGQLCNRWSPWLVTFTFVTFTFQIWCLIQFLCTAYVCSVYLCLLLYKLPEDWLKSYETQCSSDIINELTFLIINFILGVIELSHKNCKTYLNIQYSDLTIVYTSWNFATFHADFQLLGGFWGAKIIKSLNSFCNFMSDWIK